MRLKVLYSTPLLGIPMKAFILAAGKGTRMWPLTTYMPKPLLTVAGKPFLEHTISALQKVGIKEIIVLVGWQHNKIIEYFRQKEDGKDEISFLRQEKQLGTADALNVGKDYFFEDFLCINGDIVITQEILKELLNYYKDKKENIIGLKEIENPKNYGIVYLKDEKVTDIVEKPERPESNLINAGIYVFTPEIFEAVEATKKSPRGEYELTDSLKILAKNGKLLGKPLKSEWREVGKPWDLLEINEFFVKLLKNKIEGEIEDSVVLKGNIEVGEGSLIKSGTYIEGPVIIGRNSTIGPNSYIRKFTSIGDNCRIGAASEVKNSIIMSRSKIPHHNYVGDSIIGRDCNLGSGTKVANLRLDKGTIYLFFKGERISTGRKKLGTIMGDNVQTGINSTINVGSLIGANSRIGPGAVVFGVIEENSVIL